MKNISKILALSLLAGLSLSPIAPIFAATIKKTPISPVEEQAIRDRMAEQQRQFPWTQKEANELHAKPDIANLLNQLHNAKTMEETMLYINAFKSSTIGKNMSQRDQILLAIILANIIGEKTIDLLIAQKRAQIECFRF